MVDDNSLNQRLAARVRQLRQAAGLSLDGLAARCGVSRSMLSLIERGETSPTAVVLERVAHGLGLALAELFQAPPGAAPPPPVARRAEQAEWTDPGSGYRRRSLTPPGVDTVLQLVEVRFPPGARVAYETGARAPAVQQQVWLMAGTLQITVGPVTHQLAAGDCLAMRLDAPTAFYNPGHEPAQYLVAVATLPAR
ncbi:helix-turn-helix domain-containing protein [Aquabacterium sp. OR-4]|uniref:helix-turn-helix domain-containing protein n=1 Tax=Aquabacterium sp. OR-4 TaxID=2978127 RepID=UPI0028C866E5|nr:XRE family transcriptional regulator [Aquabacterium sp. OR-4]MDT7834648.1 XRE family transcriptional regulator [Aquabacterium sp. OR-4]